MVINAPIRENHGNSVEDDSRLLGCFPGYRREAARGRRESAMVNTSQPFHHTYFSVQWDTLFYVQEDCYYNCSSLHLESLAKWYQVPVTAG